MTAPMDTNENAPAGWSPAKGERINESKEYSKPAAPISATGPRKRLKIAFLMVKRELLERLSVAVADELFAAEQALQNAALSELGLSADPLQFRLCHGAGGALRMIPKPGSGEFFNLADPAESVMIFRNGQVAREGLSRG